MNFVADTVSTEQINKIFLAQKANQYAVANEPIKARKAKAWVASHKLKEICKYDLRKEIKIIPFVALMDSKH